MRSLEHKGTRDAGKFAPRGIIDPQINFLQKVVDISFVTARDDGAVDLHLDPPHSDVPPPAPFIAIPGGWRLPTEAPGFTFAVAATLCTLLALRWQRLLRRGP